MMSIVENPMHHGKDFKGGSGKEEEGGLKICQNGSFETQLGPSEEGERGAGEMKEEKSKVEEGEVEKVEEEVEKKEVKEEKMFADSCVQTGPPSFRMVRFKQESAGPAIR